jgi:hypothetical protein
MTNGWMKVMGGTQNGTTTGRVPRVGNGLLGTYTRGTATIVKADFSHGGSLIPNLHA